MGLVKLHNSKQKDLKPEPRAIAIVGQACRLPGGVRSPAEFWRLLSNGEDAVSEIPDSRWDKNQFLHPGHVAGTAYTMQAGVLDDIAGFDAGFFGLAPREVEQMDPQQRLMLELAWEALEKGGQVPERLAGSNCGVYIGSSTKDYADVRQGDPAGANAYFMLGSTLSIIANRISYLFDLRGPSLAIDTACSSALVAFHEAFHAVRDGRCDMAIVGAVNVLLSPYLFVGFSQASMLSPTGRCKTFDKSADGYVRAEGGGAVVLKPLDAAERDGDPILAIVKGVGINADGKTHGIAQPSAERQEELLRRVYRECGADPQHLVYFEAHGTGTAVGDPIEARAIGYALGKARSRHSPLPVGSAKSNIGHLESASGMAGLIKGLGVLRHGMIPQTLHVTELNPNIPFDDLNLAVATTPAPIARPKAPALVGVNSFGFGGANAHVVLQEYRGRAPARSPQVRPPLFISGKTPAALAAASMELAKALQSSDPSSYYDLAYTLAHRRTHHAHRLVMRPGADDAPADAFFACANGNPPTHATTGQVLGTPGKVAFVYSGNGAQWLGMGTRLLTEDEVFRKAVEEVDALVRARAGWSILTELQASPDTSRLADTQFAQPMLFAIQIGITASLRARGLAPEAAAGHSVGEIAAAYAAGAFDLEQAVYVILCRSAIQARTRGQGGMVAIQLPAERVAAEIAPFGTDIELAAINGPGAVTVAGDRASLRKLTQRLQRDGVEFRELDLDYPFHSRYLDPFEAELGALLGMVRTRSTELPLYSTVTGEVIEGERLGTPYWWQNARLPVRFHQAIAAMIADGCNLFVEIGPKPILQGYIRQALRAAEGDGMPLAVLDPTDSGVVRLIQSVDRAFCAGAPLNWPALFPRAGRHVDLPTYPWQRERHWYPVTTEARGTVYSRSEAPLLGHRVAPGVAIWERLIDTEMMPILADHRVGGSAVFPAAGFLEIALEASRLLLDSEGYEIEQFEIRRALVLDAPTIVRFTWNDSRATFEIASRRHLSDDPWNPHVTGRLNKPAEDAGAAIDDPGPGAERVAAAEHYALAARLGLEYGPHFQTVSEVSVEKDTAHIVLDPIRAAGGYQFILHPALFDGCLQGLFDLLKLNAGTSNPDMLFLPAQFGRIRVHGSQAPIASCNIKLRRRSLRSIVADFSMRDAAGRAIVDVRGARFQRMDLDHKSRAPLRYMLEPVSLVADWSEPPTLPPVSAPAARAERDGILDTIAAAWCMAAASAPATQEKDRLRALVTEIGCEAPSCDAIGLWRSTLGARPDLLAELTMLGRAGMALKEVLAGADAATALPSAATLEHFLDASPSVAGLHAALVDLLVQSVRSWPKSRRLRVLEVGGRSINLTRRLLATLPKDTYDYVVAVHDDDSAAHIEAELPEIRVVKLTSEGLSDVELGAAFDIILAANSSGAWRSIETALAQLAGFARKGTRLVIADLTPTAWLKLLAGLYEAAGLRFELAADSLGAAIAHTAWSDVTVSHAASGSLLTATCRETMFAPASRSVPADPQPWLVVAGDSGIEAEVASGLEWALDARGQRVVRIHSLEGEAETPDGRIFIDTTSPAAWRDLFSLLNDAGSPPRGIVHLVGLGRAADQNASVQKIRCWPPMAIAQGAADSAPFELVLVASRTANFAEPGTDLPVDAPLWGLARVLRNELSKLRIRSVELHHRDLTALTDPLADEIFRPSAEDEVVIDRERRIGFRLRENKPVGSSEEGDGRILTFASGSLDKLAWVPSTRRAPAAGEIEVEVRAAGLNFRDVMLAQGVLPDEAVENGFAGATIGMEASGVVTRTGSGVSAFAAGDEVLCFAPACFATHVTVQSTIVAPKPAALSFAAAATIPAVFFTVYYALGHLGNLGARERVLIHGAAGGVGIAAIQYARHVGAEIFATVGSPEKRDMVRLLGVPDDHIFDSRDLAFAEQILALTKGEGVDVVLNSLAGEAIHRSLGVLRPFGRFLELGKRDFFANTPMGLRPFRNNISYFGIDADQLIAVRPDLSSRLFAETMDLFAKGVFTPLPYRAFSPDRVVEAFRHMQQSRHIGKIILAMDELQPRSEEVHATASAPKPLALDPAATYLVTGGLGGFGLATGRWLAAKGARNLVLVGRKGATGDATKAVLSALAAEGVSVTAAACDVTDHDAVAAMIRDIPEEYPLKGVFHAAAVFDDATAGNMTWTQFERVVAPKMLGGDALHAATTGLPLDFFVLFSSVTTLLGNPGQANYVAANFYLEALARHRRAQGLPALAVGWSAISDAGYLARNGEVMEHISGRMGVEALSSEAALGELETLLTEDHPPVVCVAALDWRRLRPILPSLSAPAYVGIAGTVAEAGGGSVDMLHLLRNLSPEEVRIALVELVSEQVALVLRMPVDRIDPDKSVFDLGMDSLMAMELRLAIEERFAVDLPTMAIAEGATITRLAERIRDRLLGVSKASVSDQVSEVLSRHSEDASVDVAAITARLANPAASANTAPDTAPAGANPKQ